MIPGFTALSTTSSSPGYNSHSPSVLAAGVWDTPTGDRCKFARTDTFCTGLVLWCKEVFVCNNNTVFGYEKTKTPYPCGLCVGISDPSDW